jgi:integrase
MKLSDLRIKNLKPKDNSYKAFDGEGLFLLINKRGSKLWRLKYRIDGKEKLLALGSYPDISLQTARALKRKARELLAKGIDPSERKKEVQLQRREAELNTFESVTREYLKTKEKTLTEETLKKMTRMIETDVLPFIGKKPIHKVKVANLVSVFDKIKERGVVETVRKCVGYVRSIYIFAVKTGVIDAKDDLGRYLEGVVPQVKTRHFAAYTEPQDVSRLMKLIYSYNNSPVVAAALRLAPLVFVRPGELRKAKWSEINFQKAEWRFKVSKTDTELIVPLSTQAVKILKEIQPRTGEGKYVFPCHRSSARPMSENAITAALRYLGIPKGEMTGHGFRAMARTMLEEELGYSYEIIEPQMAHKVRDPLGRAYNRTKHLKERKKMMQDWADYLESLKERNL